MNSSTKPRRHLALFVAVAFIFFSLPVLAQRDERPEVHSEFRFGTFPWSKEAAEMFASEDARSLAVGFHQGWSVDKFVKETERPRVQVLRLMERLSGANLVQGETDYDMRPAFPVLREADLESTEPSLARDAEEMTGIIESRWSEIESFVSSLEADGDFPSAEILYRVVVGGLLLDGMADAFYDDKTLMPGPPRRADRNSAYYAWLVEGEDASPHLVLETDRVGRYRVVSVGPAPVDELRMPIEGLAREGPVYEDADARRWRIFNGLFSRDHLLPYMKSRRSALLELHSKIAASRYSAFAEFVAWYYQSLVARVADRLVAAGRLASPETSFRYALRMSR